MESFFKDNWLKIIVAIAILIVVVFIGFYFMFAVSQNGKRLELEQQQKCNDAGEKAYKEDSLRYGANNMLEPSYTYNKKLNLCLYSGGYSNEDLSSDQCGDVIKHSCKSYWERWVKNSFTNDSIISVVNFTDNKGDWTAKTEVINKFWEEYKQLMGFNNFIK